MAYIYEYIKHAYPNNINEGLFYDLGSGTGKAVLAMSLMHKFKKCIGIEYLDNLIQLSQGIKQNYDQSIINIFESNRQLFSIDNPNTIEFIQGDFFKHSWEDATIIFANSTCFSMDMIKNIAEKANKECKSGTIIITFTKRLTKLNADWELKDGFRRLMTWGIATIYIHRRK
jgi:precorrin-6B methylase 2